MILTDLTRVEPSQQVQTVQANSEPTVVVGLNLYDRSGADRTSGSAQPASLEYIRVTFDNVGSDHDFTPSDLLPISTVEDFYPRGNGLDDDGDGLVDEEILDGQDNDGDERTDEDCEGNGQFDPLEGEFDWNGDGIPNRGRDSGVAIYRDSALYGKPGVFDPADELVFLDGDEVFGNLYGFPNTIQLNLDRFGDEDGVSFERIPADDLGSNQGNDYFVVIRTSSAVSNGDDFRVRVSPVAANGVVEWPMHFQPRQTNGIFEYTYSYEAVTTKTLRANTQTDTVFTNLVKVGQKIETNSDPTAVLGINMNDSGNNPARRLNRVKVRIYAGLPGQADNAASGFNVSDLNAFSNTVNSGLSVYRDVSGAGRNGEFDYAIDQRLNQTVSSYIPYYDGNNDLDYVEAEINLSPGVDLPDDELGENKGLDFYVVVRTSSTISLDACFTVEIQSNGLTFEAGESLGNKAVTTLPLTSNVPVFFSNRTNVYNNQVGTNSLPRVAIAMDMNSGTQLHPDRSNESIVSLVVQFNRENDSAFVNTDIADPLTNSPLSGVALYRDNSVAGSAGDGRFNEDEDIYIPLKLDFVPSFGGENEVYLLFDPTTGLTDIPATNTGDNVGADFFIVFRTSESITHNSQFSVTVKDIRFVERNSERYFTSNVVTGWDVNHPPEIDLISPVVGDRASSEPFPVRWHGYDDDEAYVSLYYMDESAFQARSILTVADILSIPLTQLTPLQSRTGALAVDLPLSESMTQFNWDVTQVAIGDKRVIAIVTDVRQAQSGAYSPGPLRITNELPTFAFAQPDGVADTVVRGTPYTISWTDSDPENNARIELFIRLEGSADLLELPGGRNLYEDADGVSDTYKVTTTQLTPGTYYPVARITDGVLRNGNIPVNEVVCAFPFIVLQNAAPDLALLTPDATQSRSVFNGELFEIRWTDKDDDSNAVISLYYDTDRVLSGNEIPIEATNEIGGVVVYATGIPEGTGIEGATDAEDGPDSFLWDVSRLAAGKYYQVARITDGVNPAVLRYSPSFVTIDKKPSFLFVEPDGVEDEVIQGQTFILTWLANDPDSAAKITLYLDTDTDPGAGPADRGFELPLPAPLVDNDGAGVVAFAVNTALLPALTERTLFYPLAKVVDNNNTPLFVYAEYPLAVQPNAAPSLAFTRPGAADASGAVQGGNVYEVRWNDLDPDYEENAPGVTIELYYDTNSSGLDGIPLKGSYESSLGVVYDSTGIPLQDANALGASADQGRNVFQWDLSGVPVGTYYVYAILKDGLERDVPLFAYSQNPIRVNKKPTFKFLEPDGVADRVIQGLSYEISWIDGDADSNASIDLYLSTDRVTLGTKLTPSSLEENSTPNVFEFSSAGFKPGSYYPIAKVWDEDTQLTVVSTYAIAVTENATPAVKLLTPPLTGAVVFGDTFEIRWLDSNPDNDPRDPAYVNLYYDTDNRELNGTLINPAPIAQTDSADSYSWNVASAGIAPGTYYLYATIEDRSQRILFDYRDGPLIVPEPGSRFFYGLHTLSRDGVVTSYDTSEERTFTGVDFGYDTGVNLEASLDGKTILAVDEAGVVRAARAGQAIDPAVQQAQTGFEPLVAALQGPGGGSRLPVGDRRVIDLEFDLNGAGYYLLDSYGELYASQGVVDPLITPAVSGIFGWDIARDFEITQTARGGYILAGDGGVVPLGDAPVISTPYFGWDIARDLEVVSGGYYLLDGLGGVYAVGSGVESFSSPYFGVDAAQDLLAIDGGGYFILFDSGKVAIGGDRISAPSGMTQIVTQVYDTGMTNLADFALSGDIQTFFSEELIQVSVERFSAAFRARNLAGIEGELSIYYDDGSAASEAAKLQDFQEFFASPYSETENFGLSDLNILLAEDRQSAIVTGETTLISMEVTETTHSALIERNAIPDENTFSIPSSNIEARNLASTAMTFQLAQSQKVTFERQGEPESYILYLDYQKNEFDAWKPRTKFALSEVSKKVLDLEGGEGYTYRVVLVDPSNRTSIITQPLGIRFFYADVQETPEPYTVIFQYSQDSPGFWQIRSVNVPAEK